MQRDRVPGLGDLQLLGAASSKPCRSAHGHHFCCIYSMPPCNVTVSMNPSSKEMYLCTHIGMNAHMRVFPCLSAP
jgi:hypothetical protein